MKHKWSICSVDVNDDEVVVLLGFQHLGLARVVTVLLYRVKCNQVVLNTHDYKLITMVNVH